MGLWHFLHKMCNCSEDKRCLQPNASLYSNASQSGAWRLGYRLLFYSINSLIEAHRIFLSILVLNQSLIRWLKRRPRTYLNRSPCAVVPRCICKTGPVRLHEYCLSQKCVEAYLIVEHRTEVYIWSQKQSSRDRTVELLDQTDLTSQ